MEKAFKIQEGTRLISRTRTYHVDKILKQRYFGDLVQCTNTETGEIFAIKCIRDKFVDKFREESNVLYHVSQLNSDKNRLVKFIESFSYQEWHFIVFEKLDTTLLDYMRKQKKPFTLDQIRIISYQMLLALDSLKQPGITHTKMTPDNIMFVDHVSQPFHIKLIDFGNARPKLLLDEQEIPQVCGFSPLEMFLDYPLDESVDIWTLGCTLAFLFLGFSLHPTCNEYDYIKALVKHFGIPDDSLLDEGWRTKHFFTPGKSWTLKTFDDYLEATGKLIDINNENYDNSVSLDDLLTAEPKVETFAELEERKAFVDLLKAMLRVNPADRISPVNALKHRFFADMKNNLCVTSAQEITSRGESLNQDSVLTQEIDAELAIQESPDEKVKGIRILKKGDVIRQSSAVYHVEEELGSGSYGQVVMCRIEETGELVALKTILEEENATHELGAMQYLSDRDPTAKYIPKLSDAFKYNDMFCFVYELLDQSLFDLTEEINQTSLKISEIRYIAKQLLETLDFLRQVGVTHTDIKPDNIMLVDHQAQPFRVKLIDFGLAVKTDQLSENDLMQAMAYRAPEIHLGIPRDESLDTWGLGHVLAFLFFGGNLCPEDEYESMRIIVKLLGLPDAHSLSTGWQAKHFFTLDQTTSEPFWRLRTPEEYEQFTGKKIEKCCPVYDTLDSLDIVNMLPETDNPAEIKDMEAFVDLLKKLLSVNPGDRILPADALGHPFITMEHLADTTNSHEITTEENYMNPNSVDITSTSILMLPAIKSCENSSTHPNEESVEQTPKAICPQEILSEADDSAVDNDEPHCVEVKPEETILTNVKKFFTRMWNEFTYIGEW